MTPCHRLYIASVDADRLEKMFAFDPGFFTVGSGSGRRAVAEIMTLCPDVLVMDSALAGDDGPAALCFLQRRMPAPPRVVYLQRTEAAHPVVDAVCPYPCGEETLLSLAHQAAERPLPLLSAPWEKERGAIAKDLLRRLGTPERLKGREYLITAADWCACAPTLRLGKRLYALLAEARATTPGAVEKAMRTAIESTWLRGDLKEIQALFGLSVDADKGKPTNNECVAMLAEHTRRELARRMLAADSRGGGEAP